MRKFESCRPSHGVGVVALGACPDYRDGQAKTRLAGRDLALSRPLPVRYPTPLLAKLIQSRLRLSVAPAGATTTRRGCVPIWAHFQAAAWFRRLRTP
jgi:hypothetical protein